MARGNLFVAAKCLMAYRRGERGTDATAGALLEAETMSLQRAYVLAHAK